MSNRQSTPVSAVYNYVDELDAENPALRSVVIDNKGMPKPLAGVSVVNETTYQAYDPSAGDIILQSVQPRSYPDGTYEQVDINVITLDGSDAASPEELLDDSVAHATIDFLGNPDTSVRHYTLDGITDVIRGDSLNAMYARRKTLGELFKDCEPQMRDNLVNWLDNEQNAAVLDGKDLDWSKALDIPDMLTIGYSCHRNISPIEEERFVNSSGRSVVTWHTTEDEDKEQVIYHSLAGLETSVNDRTTQLTCNEIVEITDDMTKVLIFDVINDGLTYLSLHVKDGYPGHLAANYDMSIEDLLDQDLIMQYLTAVGLDEEEFDVIISPNELVQVNNSGWNVPETNLTPEEVIEAYIQYTLGHDSEELYDLIRLWCSDNSASNLIYIPPYGKDKARIILFTTKWLTTEPDSSEEDKTTVDNNAVAPWGEEAPHTHGTSTQQVEEKPNASSDAQQPNL